MQNTTSYEISYIITEQKDLWPNQFSTSLSEKPTHKKNLKRKSPIEKEQDTHYSETDDDIDTITTYYHSQSNFDLDWTPSSKSKKCEFICQILQLVVSELANQVEMLCQKLDVKEKQFVKKSVQKCSKIRISFQSVYNLMDVKIEQ